jgi:hypothetical protein
MIFGGCENVIYLLVASCLGVLGKEITQKLQADDYIRLSIISNVKSFISVSLAYHGPIIDKNNFLEANLDQTQIVKLTVPYFMAKHE